jgi:hypothetical protein
MLAIFWDSQRSILETCLERGITVRSATYCNMLQRGLSPAVRSRRSGRLSDGILLLHDNACPHTATHTLETRRKLKWEVVEHAAHSPDLAPADFRFFGLLKGALEGSRFKCDKVKNAVHQ